MKVKVNGYVVGNPRAFSREFQVVYTPEQIAEFLISETKHRGVVTVESADKRGPDAPCLEYGAAPGPARNIT